MRSISRFALSSAIVFLIGMALGPATSIDGVGGVAVNQQLSENFTLDELTFSQTAARLGIDNTPNDVCIKNLESLCGNILQPLRTAIGSPIRINSGFRCAELNAAIRGSPSSQHMTGDAADIDVPGMTPLEVAEKCIALNLPYDQLIHEFKAWVHVSYDESRSRRAVLTAMLVDKKTKYVNGLV